MWTLRTGTNRSAPKKSPVLICISRAAAASSPQAPDRIERSSLVSCNRLLFVNLHADADPLTLHLADEQEIGRNVGDVDVRAEGIDQRRNHRVDVEVMDVLDVWSGKLEEHRVE